MTDKQRTKSDARLKRAVQTLLATERGREVLVPLYYLLTGPASGLDSEGLEALLTLIEEFAAGRRTFLQDIQKVLPLPSGLDPR